MNSVFLVSIGSLLLLLLGLPLGNAKTADQSLYPACPVNHNPQYYCCRFFETNNGENDEDPPPQYIVTRFSMPSGDPSYDQIWADGWAQPRQVNHPYSLYTPDSPEFVYTDPAWGCHIDVSSDELVCGPRNATPTEVTQFWTHRENPRNNNFTCPVADGRATLVSLMIDERSNEIDVDAYNACQNGYSGSTAFFTTYTEAPLVVVYVAFSLGLASIALWAWIKRNDDCRFEAKPAKRGNERNLQADLDIDLERSASMVRTRATRTSFRQSDISIVEHERIISQKGYIDTRCGTAVLCYFLFMTLVLFVLLLVVVVDTYGVFGGYLFLPGRPLTAVFLVLWFVTTIWLVGIVVLRKRILNFFRRRAPLEDCDYVHMFKPDATEVLLSDPSGISDWVQKWEQRLLPNMATKGFEQTVPVTLTSKGSRTLEFQHLRYYYCEHRRKFVPGMVALGQTYGDLRVEAEGLTSPMHLERLDLVGPNTIEIQMPSWGASLANEFFTLFYIYQIMCYVIWYQWSYWNMGIVMTVVVGLSATVNIVTKRRMQNAVVEMTKYVTTVKVCRDGVWEIVKSTNLVPGDLVQVTENWILPCDLVIVQGSTVCDESMLTGESMPVQKFPIPTASDEFYESMGSGRKHTLFSGTKVLSSGRNEKILGLVQMTGAHTSRGQLIQNILYPVPMRFKYNEHLKVVILVLFLYGVIACCVAVSFLMSNGNLYNKLNVWKYFVYMLSGILSPLLPVVITVGQVNAARRLEKLGIFSLNAQRITLSGKVRIFCFDKTGTLTKQGLDYLGCQVVQKESNVFAAMTPAALTQELGSNMQYALASCHAVGSLNGKLVGNEVELKMFAASGWKLQEEEGKLPIVSSPQGERLQVVKRFEFDHHRMSMSVVMRKLDDGSLFVFCKGSYEKMAQVCLPETQPDNYLATAEGLARSGCYVLGMAVRHLPDMSAEELEELVKNRDNAERNLSMLGLIMFRNELKEDTREALSSLKAGDTRVVMITGDNAMCGCYIARESGMISKTAQVVLADVVTNDKGLPALQWVDIESREVYGHDAVMTRSKSDEDFEIAVTGNAFDLLTQQGLMKEILLKVRIFSRMTPDGKVQCVQMHMDTGAITGMAGDGGNDAGALRLAHVGVALSDAEASIVSPFTSKPKTITSVVDLCREGRCSVATSFASVKMLIMYGLVGSTLRFVQYYNGVILSEWCFILSDGFILVGLSYVITLSGPLPKLGKQRPTSSLAGPNTVLSILGQELINIIFLYFGIRSLVTQPWYCPFAPESVDLSKWWLLSDNAMATCLFYCVVFQQQTAAFVFSFGSVYRQPIWRNYSLCLLYVVLVLLDLYLVLGDPSVVTDLFRIASSTNVVGLPEIPLPFEFRVRYLGFVLGNMAAVIVFEYFVILGPVRSFFRRKFHQDLIPMKL